MKRINTLMFALSILSVNYVSAQCSGGPGACTITTSTVSSVATKIETVGSNCVTTVNVSFDLGHNGGLKWVPLYFYDNVLPTGVCGTTPSASSNPLGFALLEYMGGTTFQVSSASVNSIAPQTGYTIITSAITGGTRINIIGLKLTKPGTCVTSQVALYIGAENSSGPGVKCYASSSFTAYEIRVSGKIDCTAPRNYDLIIDTDYKVGTASTAISGNYAVFIDVDNDGILDEGTGDAQITSSTLFSTSGTSPLNRFTQFDVDYGSSTIGDTLTKKNLLIKVVPTTLNVASLVGRLGNACGTLPVTFKQFNASLKNNDVILYWETADEIENKGFEIQRRISGSEKFETIGFVEAKAAPGLGSVYTFNDPVHSRGNISYRLAQVDVDGKKAYSGVRIVNTGTGKSQMIVYPNPSKGSARVSLPVQTGKADITLEDFSGKTIQRWAGYSSNTLQMDQLRPGIYLIRVRVQETGEQLIDRLIVQ